MEARTIKMFMNLSEESLEELRDLAGRYDVSITEATRRAIAVMKFLDDRKRVGQDLLIRNPETRQTERLLIS